MRAHHALLLLRSPEGLGHEQRGGEVQPMIYAYVWKCERGCVVSYTKGATYPPAATRRGFCPRCGESGPQQSEILAEWPAGERPPAFIAGDRPPPMSGHVPSSSGDPPNSR